MDVCFGSIIVNVVPIPALLVTLIVPPWSSAILLAMAEPVSPRHRGPFRKVREPRVQPIWRVPDRIWHECEDDPWVWFRRRRYILRQALYKCFHVRR